MSKVFPATPLDDDGETSARSEVRARGDAFEAAAAPHPGVVAALRYAGPLAGCLFALSVLKGWRLPGLWSASHFAFNYSHGFIRRGLVGELLRRTGIANVYHYKTFLVFAWSMYAVAAVMLALMIRRTCRASSRDLDLRAMVLVIAASLANTELTHLVGYLDYIGFIGTMGLLLLASRVRQSALLLALALPLAVVLPFIHEALALIFAPIMLFVIVCRILAARRDGTLRTGPAYLQLAGVLCITAVFFAGSALIGQHGTRPPEQILALKATLEQQTNFVIRHDACEALWRTAKENLEVLMPHYHRSFPMVDILNEAALPMAGSQLFTMVYGAVLVRRLDLAARLRWLLGGLFAAVVTAPLLMYLVGWDHARWHSWSIYCGFIAICAMHVLLPRRARGDAAIATPLLLLFAAIAIACDLTGRIYLFDGFQQQGFPFLPNFRFFLEQLQGGFPHVPPR